MVPRKVGTAWEITAPAKLNLYLEVLGKRTDGFHELETLLVPVRIYDQLSWSPVATGCSLTVLQQNSTPNSLSAFDQNDNLVLRAAQLVAAKIGIQAHGRFQLVKRIPTEAGLGGGSSDAAATLLLANQAWQAGLTSPELAELAAELGSDVPYFLNTGPAVCRGRGERVESLGGLPKLHFVVVKPAFGLSTPRVFAELGEQELPSAARAEKSATQMQKLIAALNRGAIGAACAWMTNRLEAAAARLAPEILPIKTALAQAGCWGQLMTGSGSTLVGIARSATQARRIARQLSAQNLGTVLATSSGW
ncbi:MAG: 4-(cytidine 5'-diphospho)-2-C-methyl-D-erythritol kinase [Bythopirellula sp.]|nr:4-(cytidine 5'-diphospho)-2-C-methyl-D-erythritol kinase [Bythopirellula sp.]